MGRSALSLIAACWLAAGGAAARGAAGEKDSRTVKLQLEAGPAVAAIVTPQRLGGAHRTIRTVARAKIDLVGRKLDFAAVFLGSAFGLVLDCDGDGKAAPAEQVAVDGRSMAATFLLHLPAEAGKGRDYAVRFYNVRVHVTGGAATGVDADVVNQGCMAGAWQGVPVRIFDENLDGQYTQDGKDAVAIGESPFALPLLRVHRIGRRLCRLAVAPDGTSVTFDPLGDDPGGVVKPPPALAALRTLVLADDAEGIAVDAIADGANVPAGKYRLSYALLSGAGRTVLALGGAQVNLFEIKAAHLNVLRMGPPLVLDFSARQVNQTIQVGRDVRVYGCGGEEYRFDLAGLRPLGELRVAFLNGRAVLSNGFMQYADDRWLQDYANWIPSGMTRQFGRVVLTTALPLLGDAAGARTMEEVLARTRTPPVPPAGPSVLWRPLAPKKPAPPERPPVAAAPVVAQPPRPAAAATAPARPLTDSQRAELMLTVAKAFLDDGLEAKGVEKLNELRKAYPDSDAALRAGDILDRIRDRAEQARREGR